MKNTTPEILESSIDLYVSGTPMLKVCANTGICFSTLQKHLQRRGLSRSNRDNSRKHSVNHAFFRKIDSEESAYWLGFLYADGFITRSNKQKMVGVALNVEDRAHLEKFKTSVSATYPIGVYHGKCYETPVTYARVLMTSDQMFNDLQRQGVVLRKSLILRYPDNSIVPHHLESHFIRGYFDGDGSWANTGKRDGIAFKVCGTWEFLTSLAAVLGKPDLKLEQRHKGRNSHQLTIGGRHQVSALGQRMYSGCTIFLDRKFDKFHSHENSTCLIDVLRTTTVFGSDSM